MRFILAIFFLCIPIRAATVTAASASRADVGTAYAATVDGDILRIPAGDVTWTSKLSIDKAILVVGAGTNLSGTFTRIRPSANNLALFRIFKSGARVSQIAFDGNSKVTTNQGLVQVGNVDSTAACDNLWTIADWRIDRCLFSNVGTNDLVAGLTGNPAIITRGYTYGVIDQNNFFDCYAECLDMNADGTGDNPMNPLSLQRSLDFGGYTNGVIYIENNLVNYTIPLGESDYGGENWIDGNSGGRQVIRFNTINVHTNSYVQAIISNHETCAPGSCDGATQGDVGSLSMEIYGNVLNNYGGVGQWVHQRSGRSLIYSNAVNILNTGSTPIVRLSNFRSYHRLNCGAQGERGYDEVCHEAISGGVTEGLDDNKTTLNGGINNSVTTITLTSTAGFDANGLANGFAIRIGSEMINYTGVSGNQLTGCTRGQNGTSAASHSTGANVDYLKFGVCIEQINNTYIWANTRVNGSSQNTATIGGDLTAPDYSSYDIRSFAVRPNNWQYQENTEFAYTPFDYPHPLVEEQDGGGSTLSDGLVSYWKMEEAATGPWIDDIGTNDLLLASGTAFQNTGKIDNALDLDSASVAVIQASDNTSLSLSSAFSVSLWIFKETVTANLGIISKWTYATEGGWVLQSDSVDGAGLMAFIADSSTDPGNNFARITTIGHLANTWYHVVMVFDGTQTGNADRLKFYNNGTLLTVTTFGGTIPATVRDDIAPLRMGMFGGDLSRHFNGRIDEVRLWNRALTSGEVTELYNLENGADITAPTLSSSTIPSGGTTISLAFDETVSVGAGGNGGWTISMTGGAATLTYSSGSGTSTLVYSINRMINSGETGTVAYTQPGNGTEDSDGNDLATIGTSAVTNNSSQSGGAGGTSVPSKIKTGGRRR